jgi:uncharacterized surface protein with fasciclin (FAS1) repeats
VELDSQNITITDSGSGEPPVEQDNLIEVATEAGNFTTLLAAVEAAGLTDTLSNSGPYTVCAPTDAAFADLPAGTVEALLNDIPTLTDILLYHVVDGTVLEADVVNLTQATTLNGDTVSIDTSSGVKINESNVIATDILAENGVIHVIDAVLLPPDDPAEPTGNIIETAEAAGNFTIMLQVLEAAGLTNTIANGGPFTVFAPSDDAFADLAPGTLDLLLANAPLLTDILLYHVASGEFTASELSGFSGIAVLNGRALSLDFSGPTPMVEDAEIVDTDIFATNGVIHVIDSVLIP